MSVLSIDQLNKDLASFCDDLNKTEKEYNDYRRLYKDVCKQQQNSAKSLKHLRYLMKLINQDIKSFELSNRPLDDEKKVVLSELREKLKDGNSKLNAIERELPAENGLYLSVILGSDLSVSLLDADQRYRYKKGYEDFKARVSYVILGMFFLAYFVSFRPMDALCNFLLVWYYCTLTIRESILRINGSRIKGWWVFHHYVSCVLCAINLTWSMSNSDCYDAMRYKFIALVICVGIVQLVQTRYQIGCLRRLHALGDRPIMDITLEGFTSWMFRGLTFLLPFLIICYIFQAYIAYELFKLYFWNGVQCPDWQVLALALLFTFITLGNIVTTSIVILRKFTQKSATGRKLSATKYNAGKTE